MTAPPTCRTGAQGEFTTSARGNPPLSLSLIPDVVSNLHPDKYLSSVRDVRGDRMNNLYYRLNGSYRYHSEGCEQHRLGLATFNPPLDVRPLTVDSGGLGPHSLLVARHDQVLLRIGHDLFTLNSVVGVTQEEVLRKEGSDEGNETCAWSDAISPPYERLEGDRTYTGSVRAST